MAIPLLVYVCITPETLKDYVGPPVYQLYAQAPPRGVSMGLGYLRNGSGTVTPVEPVVPFTSFMNACSNRPHVPSFRVCQVKARCSLRGNRVRLSGEYADWVVVGEEPCV